MSLLIQMRQRMKAVETIKKITHAMRIISMSTHSRLRAKQEFLTNYKQSIHSLFGQVHSQLPDWQNAIMMPQQKDGRQLHIIVGSQKGLCGNFNQSLYVHFEKALSKLDAKNIDIIVIGRKMVQLTQISYGTVIKEFETFSFSNLENISAHITTIIFEAKNPYSTVKIYYNFPKTFFAQIPQAETLIPFQEEASKLSKEVIFAQPTAEILNELAHRLIYASIQQALFQSLVAEQAARFVAMDSSTRNAGSLLEDMRLNYNKMRQTKITRELTDLVGTFF